VGRRALLTKVDASYVISNDILAAEVLAASPA